MTQQGNAGITGERGIIRSHNVELGYAIEGSGTPALVVGSAVYYPRTFSNRLRETLRLVFLDHGGHGRLLEGFQVPDYGLDTILADIEAARRHLGLDDVIVIGHSGNGYLALEYAKAHPRHVSHVVMIGTGPSLAPTHMQLAERCWEEAVCPERKARLEAELRQLDAHIQGAPERRFAAFCIRMGARSWYDHEFDATPLWEGVHLNMPVIDHMWGKVFRDIDVARDLEAMDIPVLLALGRFDYLVPPHFAWDPYRDRFRDLTLRVFDRSGHTPQLEEGEAFDAELLRWLADHPRR